MVARTIREVVVGRTTLRLPAYGGEYVDIAFVGARRSEPIRGDDHEEELDRLRRSAGEVSPSHSRYDDNRECLSATGSEMDPSSSAMRQPQPMETGLAAPGWLPQPPATYGPLSWPVATYLPFLWRPNAEMFLKPQLTGTSPSASATPSLAPTPPSSIRWFT